MKITKVSDAGRLAELAASELLDSPPEAAFDRFTALASKILRVPVTLVSLVDENRQYFKSAVGLSGPYASLRQTPLSHSFCQHVVNSGQPLVVAVATDNPLVSENLAIRDLGVVAYAGIPLTTSTGQTLGSFCAIDHVAREWSVEEIAILTDLAAAVTGEIEVRLAGRRLRDSLVKLRQLEALRDDLTHMLVHDLRTPLTSLLLGLDSLPMLGDLSPAQQQVHDLALRGGRALAETVDDILAISKMESGSVVLNLDEVEVAELVERARAQVSALATARETALAVSVATDIPRICVDADLVVRALVNLLGNALKFTPPGGAVVLDVCPATPGRVAFSVSDNGPGIAAAECEKIFQKFATGAGEAGSKVASSGIGLAFCKLASEAHGGTIAVVSHPGRGSTFTISLPIQPDWH